ncbi:hypothetical protein K438DRAFT_2062608 [Mycena galopus ATCC 62051]|nr:hypothetical protein K438DRAFT_2062608 [Mycena galopus ATCC 62051]
MVHTHGASCQLHSRWALGIFLCIRTMSAYTLIRKGLRGRRPRQALLAITSTMLVSCTAHLALYMSYIIIQLQASTYPKLYCRGSLYNLQCSVYIFSSFPQYFLSDIIVVWRAWVIWQDNRMVHAALAVCLVTTGATSLILAVFNIKSEFQGVHYATNTKNFLGTFSLLVTNFLATILITCKLWYRFHGYYRRNVKKYLNHPGNANTKIENILILLMETGGLYCAFWILLMVGDYGYYGHVFEFKWFQPNISVRFCDFAAKIQPVDASSWEYILLLSFLWFPDR